MKNPLRQMVLSHNDTPNQVYDRIIRGNGVISQGTFYRVIDEDGIPPNTEWGTVVSLANAFGYDIEFIKREYLQKEDGER